MRFEDKEDQDLFLLTLETHDIELVNLGESDFGDIVGGYAVSITDSPPITRSRDTVLDRPFKQTVGARELRDYLMSNPDFFQLGPLQYCTGQDWADVLRHNEHSPSGYRVPYKEGTFKDTGYSVMVKIDDEGHPSKEIFAVLNPQLEPRVVHAAPGPLYKENGPQFLVAKIADSLEDLTKYARFNFEIVVSSESPGPHEGWTF